MLTLQGKSVFKDIAIGPLVLLHHRTISAAGQPVQNPETEVRRFQQARKEAVSQLQELYEKAVEKVGEEQAAIFEVHQIMLDDADYIESVEGMIRGELLHAETAVEQTAKQFAGMFQGMDDAYMQARAADVWDISRRIEQLLGDDLDIDFSKYDQVIIAADDLSPSETLQLDTDKILGFITEKGGTNSHTAILARTLGIAAVVDTGIQIHEDADSMTAIIDGMTGTVYVNPDEATLQKMKEKKRRIKRQKERLEMVRGAVTETKDGKSIHLYANIGNLDTLPQVSANDAEGIGLFRSEFLYLESHNYPTEEQQFEAYKRIAEALQGKPVIIRTLDIGADKNVDYFGLEAEENPAMGMRAIRICLTRPELFKTQLRALLRASAYGKIAIMFPLIISVDEVRQCKAIIQEVRYELDSKNITYDKNIELGIMIETPAAAIMSDELAKEVDFFSIGSNDLTQYTLAIDRQQTNLDAFFNSHHPAVLRLIQQVIKNGHQAGIWVGICGELGADLTLTELFLKMGVDELSVNPSAILPLREKIRSIQVTQ